MFSDKEAAKDLMKTERVFTGLVLLSGHARSHGGEAEIAAEHDVIYAGVTGCPDLSEEDQKVLENLGWSKNEEFGYSIFT